MLVLVTARRASEEVVEEADDDAGIKGGDTAASLVLLPAPAPATDAVGLVVIPDLKVAEDSVAETSWLLALLLLRTLSWLLVLAWLLVRVMGAADNGDNTSSSPFLGLALESSRGPPKGEASASRRLALMLVLIELLPMGGVGTREDDCCVPVVLMFLDKGGVEVLLEELLWVETPPSPKSRSRFAADRVGVGVLSNNDPPLTLPESLPPPPVKEEKSE
jgi:hypothetical protein